MYISNDKNWIRFLQHMYKHSAAGKTKPCRKKKPKKQKSESPQINMFNEE